MCQVDTWTQVSVGLDHLKILSPGGRLSTLGDWRYMAKVKEKVTGVVWKVH